MKAYIIMETGCFIGEPVETQCRGGFITREDAQKCFDECKQSALDFFGMTEDDEYVITTEDNSYFFVDDGGGQSDCIEIFSVEIQGL